MIAASRVAGAAVGVAAGLLVVLIAVDGARSGGSDTDRFAPTSTAAPVPTPPGSDTSRPSEATTTTSSITSTSTTSTTSTSTSTTSEPDSGRSSSTTTTIAPPADPSNPEEQAVVTVPLRCIGVDAEGSATFPSSDALEDFVRVRLAEFAVVTGTTAGLVVDSDVVVEQLVDVGFDLRRCTEAETIALANDPRRWPCLLAEHLVINGSSDLDELIDYYEIGCSVGLHE